MKFINFFHVWVIFVLLDPDPDPGTPLNPATTVSWETYPILLLGVDKLILVIADLYRKNILALVLVWSVIHARIRLILQSINLDIYLLKSRLYY